MTPELESKISLWRAKAEAGTLSKEEMIEAVKALREGRTAAIAAATAKKASATSKKVVVDPDALLDELKGL